MFRIQNTNHCRQLILKDKAPIRESASIFEDIFHNIDRDLKKINLFTPTFIHERSSRL